MQFLFKKIDSLPKLAWCTVMERGKKEVEVFHGPWVETGNSFFVEGAWDGPFAEGEFDTSGAFMGTGGKIVNDKMIFSTPCHVQERIHILNIGTRLFISPSLAFLLKKTGYHLDLNYIPYQVDLLNMVLKMDNHIGSIPTRNGASIHIYHYRNLEIDSELRVHVLPKKEPPDFESFQSYKDFLVKSMISLHRNANSSDRSVTYSPIVTVSSGYDSTACAALSTEIGCKDAISFQTARPEKGIGKNSGDSGKKIAEKLGLTVKEYDRLTYLSKNGMPEAEFVACGDLGQDLLMSALDEEFYQRLVIVGNHGGHIWDCNKNNVKRDIIRLEASGCCWIDFKFRVGLIYVPLSFIGCLSHPSIHAISNSTEMEPWRMWNRYDKPIPRRIVEEKGIDRSLFGQKKKAVTVLLNSNKRLKSQMKPESYVSFEKYYQKNKKYRKTSNQFFYTIMYSLNELHYLLFHRPNQLFSRLGFNFKIPNPVPNKFSQTPGRASFLVHWGISTICNRYETSSEQTNETKKSLRAVS